MSGIEIYWKVLVEEDASSLHVSQEEPQYFISVSSDVSCS